MQCPNCHREVREGALFCTYCSFQLLNQPAIALFHHEDPHEKPTLAKATNTDDDDQEACKEAELFEYDDYELEIKLPEESPNPSNLGEQLQKDADASSEGMTSPVDTASDWNTPKAQELETSPQNSTLKASAQSTDFNSKDQVENFGNHFEDDFDDDFDIDVEDLEDGSDVEALDDESMGMMPTEVLQRENPREYKHPLKSDTFEPLPPAPPKALKIQSQRKRRKPPAKLKALWQRWPKVKVPKRWNLSSTGLGVSMLTFILLILMGYFLLNPSDPSHPSQTTTAEAADMDQVQPASQESSNPIVHPKPEKPAVQKEWIQPEPTPELQPNPPKMSENHPEFPKSSLNADYQVADATLKKLPRPCVLRQGPSSRFKAVIPSIQQGSKVQVLTYSQERWQVFTQGGRTGWARTCNDPECTLRQGPGPQFKEVRNPKDSVRPKGTVTSTNRWRYIKYQNHYGWTGPACWKGYR